MMREARTSPRTRPLDRCPVCESNDTEHFFTAPDRLHATPGEFSYNRCRGCASVFQNPMIVKEDLHLCYPSDYAPHNITRRDVLDVNFDRLPGVTLRDRLRKAVVATVRGDEQPGAIGFIGRLMSRSAVARTRAFFGLVMDECLPYEKVAQFALDVGCGSGWFMQRLEKVGWQVEGLEWDEKAADLARMATGSRVLSGDFLTADLTVGKYHLIVFNHVFEHFDKPHAVLERVRQLLAPNGKAVLLYPNPQAWGVRQYGSKWFPWEVPRHLILPSVNAMQILAKRAAFSSSRVYSRAYYSDVHWQRSRAYASGRHPENDPPPLALSDRLGIAAERMITMCGYNKGWEIVAVLDK